VVGKTPCTTDDGVEVLNYCQIFYQCQSLKELHLTSLKIVELWLTLQVCYGPHSIFYSPMDL
jgi:hypothetical protein